jgi:hypothetical protein
MYNKGPGEDLNTLLVILGWVLQRIFSNWHTFMLINLLVDLICSDLNQIVTELALCGDLNMMNFIQKLHDYKPKIKLSDIRNQQINYLRLILIPDEV